METASTADVVGADVVAVDVVGADVVAVDVVAVDVVAVDVVAVDVVGADVVAVDVVAADVVAADVVAADVVAADVVAVRVASVAAIAVAHVVARRSSFHPLRCHHVLGKQHGCQVQAAESWRDLGGFERSLGRSATDGTFHCQREMFRLASSPCVEASLEF